MTVLHCLHLIGTRKLFAYALGRHARLLVASVNPPPPPTPFCPQFPKTTTCEQEKVASTRMGVLHVGQKGIQGLEGTQGSEHGFPSTLPAVAAGQSLPSVTTARFTDRHLDHCTVPTYLSQSLSQCLSSITMR